VIVTIAAWLYIIDAVLILGSLLLSPWGFNGIEGLVSLALAGLFGAMGIGLLKRLPWARWLAMGSSLLGWALGSLFLILLLGFLVVAAPAASYLSGLMGGGIFSFFGVILLLVLLIWVVGIVINYKLFWYLCSEAGCEEFGVPYGSTRTVLASCGAWIGIFIVNGMMSGGGQAMSALMSGGDDTAQYEVTETEEEAEARREEEAYAERRERAEAMLREQAELEAANAAGQQAEPAEPQSVEPEQTGSAGSYAIEESPVPVAETTPDSSEESEDSGESTATRILKCVDASGGTIFTQGYCPPGSKPVRTPANP
jgi:hypothetical protein